MAEPAHRCHVLLIDDEPNLRELMQSFLEEVGHTVACADNGQEALDRLEHPPAPCIILLDIRMPVMDGHEFYRRARLQPHLKDIPIVVVSTHPGEGELETAGFLAKPFDLDTLLEAVRSNCHRAAPPL